MTRRWLVAVTVAGLGWACTRANPAFEDDGQGSEAEAGSSATSVGDASAEDGPEPTTTSVDGSSGAETTSDTGPVPEECSFPPAMGLEVGEMLALAYAQCGGITRFGVHPQAAPNGGMLSVLACVGGCGCPAPSLISATLVFGAPLPGFLPQCFDLEVQHRASDTGAGCQILAYAILEGETPLSVVSNVVDPAVTEPFTFELKGSPSPPCEGGCNDGLSPGHYILHSALSGGLDVPPDGTPVPSSSGPVTYDIVNVGSGINGACNEVGRWYAVPQ